MRLRRGFKAGGKDAGGGKIFKVGPTARSESREQIFKVSPGRRFFIAMKCPPIYTEKTGKSCIQTCNILKNFLKKPLGVQMYGLLRGLRDKNSGRILCRVTKGSKPKRFRRPFLKRPQDSNASWFCYCSTALGKKYRLGCLADKTPRASGRALWSRPQSRNSLTRQRAQDGEKKSVRPRAKPPLPAGSLRNGH